MKEMAQIWEHWEEMFYLQEQETETEMSYENESVSIREINYLQETIMHKTTMQCGPSRTPPQQRMIYHCEVNTGN